MFGYRNDPTQPAAVRAGVTPKEKADAAPGKWNRFRIRLQGDPPSPIDIPRGCRFAGRCPFAEDRCRNEPPVLREVLPGHRIACHRVGDDGRVMYGGLPDPGARSAGEASTH